MSRVPEVDRPMSKGRRPKASRKSIVTAALDVADQVA
jgi:hypothetical protein